MNSSRRDPDPIQRRATIAFGLGIIGVVGWLTFEQGSRPIPHASAGERDASAEAATDASPGDASGTATVGVDGGIAEDAGVASEGLEAGAMPSLFGLPEAGGLPSSAPRTVKLGVILVHFAGAEGAPATARSKAAAQALAEKLAGEAKADFSHTLGQGDPGSSSDIGRIPRGVLDPRTEGVVFALSGGEVSDAIETPRGFWIVKRLDQ